MKTSRGLLFSNKNFIYDGESLSSMYKLKSMMTATTTGGSFLITITII